MKYRVTIETIPERPSDPEPGSTTRTSMHLHSAIAYGSKELNALYALASKMQTKALKKLKAVKS